MKQHIARLRDRLRINACLLGCKRYSQQPNSRRQHALLGLFAGCANMAQKQQAVCRNDNSGYLLHSILFGLPVRSLAALAGSLPVSEVSEFGELTSRSTTTSIGEPEERERITVLTSLSPNMHL